MFEDLSELLKIDINNKSYKEKLNIIEEILLKKLFQEEDFLKFVSFYGILCIIKLKSILNETCFDDKMQEFYNFFLKFLKKKKVELNKVNNKYFTNIKKYCCDIFTFSYAAIKNNDYLLFALACFLNVNDNIFLIYLCLCAIQIKHKVIFIFDDTLCLINNNNIFDIFNQFYKSIIINFGLLINNEKTLVIYFKNNTFTSELRDSLNDEILSQINNNYFEIICYKINNNNEKKNINIKNYLKTSFNFVNMEEIKKWITNLEKELKEKEDKHQKEMKEMKEMVKKYQKQIKNMTKEIENNKKEIKHLNDKISNLLFFEEKYNLLKGRFIYKTFTDYLFLILGINIEIKFDDKLKLFKDNIEKNKINKVSLSLITYANKIYNSQTEESHWKPNQDDIRKYILSLYNEEEKKLLLKFFEKAKPEDEIISLIKKNNEITKINNSKNTPEDKKKEIEIINSQIHHMIRDERRELLLNILKEIFC